MSTQSTPAPSSSAALLELVRLSKRQTQQLEQLQPRRFQIRLVSYCILASMLAASIAGVWVLEYLLTTSVGAFRLLFEYVDGTSHGSSAFESTEGLFIVTSRFFLGFGLSWMPITFVILCFDLIRQLILSLLTGSED